MKCIRYLSFLLITACIGIPVQAQSEQRVIEFIQLLDSLRIEAHIPGLSVAVVKNQEVVYAGGLGYSNPEKKIPASAETVYDVASVAKPISAVVALRLNEEGVLNLDQPMSDYSEWTDFCSEFSEQPSIFARDLQCNPSDHTLRHLLSHTATGKPGTRFLYNPVLYSWASRPVMEAAEAQFSDLVKQYVFEPARMTHSARRYRDLPLRNDLAQLLAPGHIIDLSGTAKPAPEPGPQGDGAAGGVITTVLDLTRFDIALDQGKLISVKSRKIMMTPFQTDGGDLLPYGIGWFVEEYHGQTLIWHSGWWEDAYSALYLKIPDLDLTFIILANSEGIWWNNSLDEAEVYRSTFARAFLEAFAGEY
ncbi:MAG: serine hydrolase domain-containing protein [Balneolaceae bacterium]